jgi:hypothetical protein
LKNSLIDILGGPVRSPPPLSDSEGFISEGGEEQ